MIHTKCGYCNKDIVKSLRHKRYKVLYCNNECSNLAKMNGEPRKCARCAKDIYVTRGDINNSKTANFFCTKSCSASFNNPIYNPGHKRSNYRDGRSSYRVMGIKTYGFVCASGKKCPLKSVKLDNFMYEVDHKDNNHHNNKIENLQVLCVMCHRRKTFKK